MTRYARSHPRDRNIVLLAVDTPVHAALPRGSLNLRPDNSAFAQSSPYHGNARNFPLWTHPSQRSKRTFSSSSHSDIDRLLSSYPHDARSFYDNNGNLFEDDLYYTLIFPSFCLRFDVVCWIFRHDENSCFKDVYSCTNLTSGGEVFM